MIGSLTSHIAIVEDDVHLRNSIKDLLDTAGLTSELFNSAEAFLNSQHYRSVRCVLADVRMPGMSGIELLRVLRSQPGCPPVFIMTSYADIHMQTTAIRQGAAGFLPKPIDTSLLLHLIQRVIEKE